MSVISIKATIECDECGQQFRVDLDESDIPPEGWSLWDEAEDAVRGAIGYEEIAPNGNGNLCSVQNGKMLCHKCTVVADNLDD